MLPIQTVAAQQTSNATEFTANSQDDVIRQELLVTLGSGVGTAVVAFVLGMAVQSIRERKERKKLVSLVLAELEEYWLHLGKILGAHPNEKSEIELVKVGELAEEGDLIIGSLQFPKMPIETKIRAFEPAMLASVERAHIRISNFLKRRREDYSKKLAPKSLAVSVYLYDRPDIERTKKEIFETIEELRKLPRS